jgi:beta-glucanase (GH16 family)
MRTTAHFVLLAFVVTVLALVALMPAGPALAADPIPVGKTGTWTLVARDEFSTSVLNSAWATCFPWADPAVGCTNEGELQWNLPRNVSVSGGQLHLTAHRENYTVGGTTYPWTSGMISAGGTPTTPPSAATYGYFEARIRTPGIVGSWPAFWNLPADQTWPPEIDFIETFGSTPDTGSFTYHWPPNNRSETDYVAPPGTLGGQWHVIGCEWRAGYIDWFVDGTLAKHYTDAATISSQPMYPILTLAISAGHPPDASVSTMVMDIDYIRYWR